MDTVATGRSKRATAGNRMRELLEKAHQQDEDDLFKEEEGDEEFTAPVDQRDVFLDDFADTDDEVERDDEDEEKTIRREERRKAKGKSKAIYNPLGSTSTRPKKVNFPPEPTAAESSGTQSSKTGRRAEDMQLLDPNIDASIMAKSTLVLALRKQRREQKRLHRDQTLRSSLRASTLRTEEEILEKEQAQKSNPNRKGRLAQHVTGEVRVVRKMTQDELIAAALEEEERNKESLRDWLRKEEERRELRRVGRKRVRGPRWTWVSRTVGRLVEEVEDDPAKAAATRNEDTPAETPVPESRPDKGTAEIYATAPLISRETPAPALPPTDSSTLPPDEDEDPTHASRPQGTSQTPAPPTIAPSNSQLTPVTTAAAADGEGSGNAPSQYTRNYIILSQIPGGLAKELRLVLGDHVEWDQVKYIPHRNRPINRRPTICPFTGLPARYRHPQTMTPYANLDGYRQIEALLQHRYVWNQEASMWFGGEADVGAEGVETLQGWKEATHGGWMGGEEIIRLGEEVDDDGDIIMAPRKGAKRKFFDEVETGSSPALKRGKSKRGRGRGRA